MSNEVTNKPRGKPFPPGVSPNPLGRPKGSRNAFSAVFIGDLTASWAEHGPSVLEVVAKRDPSRYLGVCSTLIPKDVTVSLEQRTGGLSEEDMEIFRAIKAALPDANSQQPGVVLNYVLDAIHAHGAKTIEGE